MIPRKWRAKIQRVPCKLRPDLGRCWNWTGILCKRKNGDLYGMVHLHRGSKGYIAAYRFIYQLEVGPIPEGMQLDHLCRNARCVNPKHLEPVTQLENIRRGLPYRPTMTATVCVNGHKKVPGPCRTCANQRYKRYHQKLRAKRDGVVVVYAHGIRSATSPSPSNSA
jgi:HNH endonuclease